MPSFIIAPMTFFTDEHAVHQLKFYLWLKWTRAGTNNTDVTYWLLLRAV